MMPMLPTSSKIPEIAPMIAWKIPMPRVASPITS